MIIMKKGFTLIELLVVISIIGLLSSIILASLNMTKGKARDAKRKIEVNIISQAFERYFLDHDHYPDDTFGGWEKTCSPGSVPQAPTNKTNAITGEGYLNAFPCDSINNASGNQDVNIFTIGKNGNGYGYFIDTNINNKTDTNLCGPDTCMTYCIVSFLEEIDTDGYHKIFKTGNSGWCQ